MRRDDDVGGRASLFALRIGKNGVTSTQIAIQRLLLYIHLAEICPFLQLYCVLRKSKHTTAISNCLMIAVSIKTQHHDSYF